jgi:3-isopropylmalate dehydrogenase
MIASFGMALRYSFDMGALADKVDAAIAAVLASRNPERVAGAAWVDAGAVS